jgi:ankyrin repeat protein
MLWRPLPAHWPIPKADLPLSLECFRLILERCDPDIRNAEFGQTMLHEAVARDHGEGVYFATMLLEGGAHTGLRDRLPRSTPLGWACRWGRTDLVKLLIARGADTVEAEAEPWATPRAWAEKMGRQDILPFLGP